MCTALARPAFSNDALRFLYLGNLGAPLPPPPSNPGRLLPPPDDTSSYLDVRSPVDFIRGGYKPIDASRIDLPTIPACPSAVWIALLPADTQPLFRNRDAGLLGCFDTEFPHRAQSLPSSRVCALPGHYPQVIYRACSSGMIVWGRIETETPAERTLAYALTLTSFAVCKDREKDRLISWPRIQNELFAEPPDVDLPHPGVLARMHLHGERVQATEGFELDVANMFHQLVLPHWLSKMLQLTAVAFGDLSDAAQRSAMRQLSLTRRPRQAPRLRPYLRTMPMDFAWAVHVSHAIANTLLRRCVTDAIRFNKFQGCFIPLSKHTTHISISSGDIVVGHIIDDVCAVGFACPPHILTDFQARVWHAFTKHGLPIKLSKSTPAGTLVNNGITFIGYR